MAGRNTGRLFTTRELLFSAALLGFYGLVIFFTPDPEWIVWAGQMVMGVLYIPDAPPLLGGGEAKEILRTAAGVGLLGALCLALLAVATDEGSAGL